VPPVDLSLLGFKLEKSTLADVEDKLGPSTEGSCSKEVEASKVVCYVSKDPSKVRVFFESGPSGGWSRLDGFKVVSESVPSCDLKCDSTNAFGADIRTNNGLRLGLTKVELVALLGPPAKVNVGRMTFERWSKRPMAEADIKKETEAFKTPVSSPYWDVHDVIEVTLSGSKVAAFRVRRTVTY
jgi:hypothetical protein